MAATVSWERLRELAGFRAEKGCAISLYVDLDPSRAPTAGDAETRVNSLLDAGERSDTARRGDLGHEEKQGLRNDFERIRRYVDDEFDRDGARGLAVFAAGLDNEWTAMPLSESVPDGIEVARWFYLAPLVPLVGRGEGALVAAFNRERGQIYHLRGGRLVDLADRSEEQPRRHDQGGWSQARLQRHVDELAAEHMRVVADELNRHVLRLHRPSIVVACAEEYRAEFEELLTQEARAALAGWVSAESHAGPAELLELARPLLEEWRARQESATLERWREEVGRNGRAAAGWQQTLEAASDGRVECLLFDEAANRQVWQCPACGRASTSEGSCPLDGTRMEQRANGVDVAVHHALAHGGSVWAVRHNPDLGPAEGIAALLRY